MAISGGVLIIDLEAFYTVLMKLSVRYRHLRRALDVPRLRREFIHGPSENCQRFFQSFFFASLRFALLGFLAYIFAWHFE